MRKSLLLLLFSSWLIADAQPVFIQDTSVKVMENGLRLKNPWMGGLNCPQFSTIDLDGDGKKDLFVFDRSGNTVKTYLNKGGFGKTGYVYAPQFEAAFPPMINFALLADYNCDGKEDIYTFYNNGIRVYKNVSTPGHLKFTLAVPHLNSLYGTTLSPIFVSSAGIPAIVDVNNDGVPDILTFEQGGIYVEYHKNMGIANYSNCDSLVYVYQKDCWGHFTASSIYNDVTLNGSCPARHGYFNARTTHGGSNAALLAFDPYAKGVKDLIIADIGTGNLLYLSNTGTTTNAQMTSKIDSFPGYGVKVNLTNFPAAFNFDADNDGVKDILITTNQIGASENTQSIWFYKNTGTSNNPYYALQTKNFFLQNMIDVGAAAAPAFFDYDGDGLLDLFVGNYAYVTKTTFLSGITVFRNTGTATKPSFNLVTTDYDSLSKMNINSIIPTFGDIDGDGDIDMVVGESGGKLYFFNNTGGAGKPANFVIPTQSWFNISVGSNSAPQLVDVNKDGLLDLLIGTRSGNIVYYRNTGSKTSPAFTMVTNTFGNVDTRKSGSLTGHNSPMLFHCSKKDMLLSGSEDGHLYLYSKVDSNLTGTFALADTAFGGIYIGPRSIISSGDINGDSIPDLVVGDYLGGVAVYMRTGNCKDSVKIVDTTHVKAVFEKKNIVSPFVRIQPNPASETFNIQASSAIENLDITDIFGRRMKSGLLSQDVEGRISINVANWPNGIYICSITLSSNVVRTVKLSVYH